MLLFIVPLQSPAASADWKFVSQLAERCLRSLASQSCPAFHIVLVCNEAPQTSFTHPALTVIEEDFPIPARGNQEARMDDKWRKIKRGLVFARSLAPNHVMCVDADDCLSSRLAKLVQENPQCHGWRFETGYMHDEGSRWLFRRDNFHQYCASSSIVRCGDEDFPRDMEEPDERFCILKSGHIGIVQGMRERGTPLEILPFVGTIYITATGENHSGFSLRGWRSRRILLQKLLRSRPVTQAVRQEFGLYELAR